MTEKKSVVYSHLFSMVSLTIKRRISLIRDGRKYHRRSVVSVDRFVLIVHGIPDIIFAIKHV